MREICHETRDRGGKQFGRGIRHEKRGTTTVELCLFLAVLASGTACVWYLTGDSARDTFHRLATRLTAADDPAYDSPPASSSLGQSGGVPAADSSVRTSRAVWLAAWFALAGAAALGWFLLRAWHRRKDATDTPQQEEDLLESVPADQRNRLFEKRHQIFRILSHQPMNLFSNRVEVRQLMTRGPLTVTPETSVDRMREMMGDRRLRHLLVCDPSGRLLGIVSDRDLSYRDGKTAGELMTPDPIAVSPEMPIGPAITMLLDKHISCVPVVDEGTPCGVLTTTDLMMSLQCALAVLTRLAAELRPSAQPQEAACS